MRKILSALVLFGICLFSSIGLKAQSSSFPVNVQTFDPSFISGASCNNGNLWFNSNSLKEYICTVNTLGVGSWSPIGGTSIVVANASSTGTTVNKLAKLTGAPSTAVIAATTDNTNAAPIGVVITGAGTTGSATIVMNGLVPCIFENSQTAGDFVTVGTTTLGDCHDDGSSLPTDGSQVIGRVLQTSTSTTVAQNVFLFGISSVTAGAATTLASLTLTGTTNQLVLGTTNTVTINSIAPAASRVISIQDPLKASNFVTSPSATNAVGATLSLTTAMCGGVTFMGATTGEVVTLPAAGTTTIGCTYDIIITVSNTSNSNEIRTTGSNYFLGAVEHSATGIAPLTFWADGSSIEAIKMDGAHLGGLLGSYFHIVGISATQWEITGRNEGTATMTTAFNTTP